MKQIRTINTYSEFLEFWKKTQNLPVTVQIEKWASEYMSAWPELLEKQISDYSSQQIAWQQIAKERVFPFLNFRLATMEEAHQNILATFDTICNQALKKLGFDPNIVCIIYVGIGCGAGWATTYTGKPAILFGLENIAECGWSDHLSIIGLTAHELGHIVHDSWRRQADKPDEDGPWWQLYTEGFAQRCEHLILEEESWHETGNTDRKWIIWCHEMQEFLASEFLSCIDEGRDFSSFFSSWHTIGGHSQTGYFLGHEAIKDLQSQGMSLREIAVLDHPERKLKEILESYVKTQRT